jgi:hypothetical protein
LTTDTSMFSFLNAEVLSKNYLKNNVFLGLIEGKTERSTF